ncbi:MULTISPECIES: MarR family winged helix-turn-helix transcriptional regulator [unclassified Rhizobium]|uniref:MarR family winged helix-turn-helix transcriptional regulator n=1 Tax=unclassified Rhizobium TaxID=2613769 RepID=UPI00247A5BD5|nr:MULTISPECIES: MarR family winged helix-turn-helix transcriptional regulator [unclassified Rhizobium]MDH7801198.1 DNA-binding MarR family transcriptional regulator [Rhizobium sp. AN70]
MKTDIARTLSTLAVAIFRTNGALIAAGDALSAPFGLSSARWQVLGAVALAGQPLTVAQIARNMGQTRQGVQRLIDEMERQGIVGFENNPHHKRAKLVHLTEKGENAYAATMRQWDELASRLATEMQAGQLNVAIDCLNQLFAGLDTDPPPG